MGEPIRMDYIECHQLEPMINEIIQVKVTDSSGVLDFDCEFRNKHNPTQCEGLGGNCALYISGEYKL